MYLFLRLKRALDERVKKGRCRPISGKRFYDVIAKLRAIFDAVARCRLKPNSDENLCTGEFSRFFVVVVVLLLFCFLFFVFFTSFYSL